MELPRTGPRLAMAAIVSLLAMGAVGCGNSDADTTALTGSEASTTVAPATITTELTATTTGPPTTMTGVQNLVPGDLQFYPVLSVAACSDPEASETTNDADQFRSDDGHVCYTLGSAGADGNDISTAEAVLNNGDWLISVTVAESSKDQVNAMFNACYQGGPTCPGSTGPGAIAIVFEGTVFSAPAVQAENLANDDFTISGNFTEAGARELALVLSA